MKNKHYSRGIDSYHFWANTLVKMKKTPEATITFRRRVKNPRVKTTKMKTPRGARMTMNIPLPEAVQTQTNPSQPAHINRIGTPTFPTTQPSSTSAGDTDDELRMNLAQTKQRFGEFNRYATHGGPWTHIGREPSARDPTHPHTISVNEHGELGCDCPGYLYHNGPMGKTCTHCEKFARAN